MSVESTQTLLFGDRFLEDHAGHLIVDPRIAMTEIVANSYDAGATKVAIVWPDETGQKFQVEDNGTGMTPEEFQRRWMTLNYNRLLEQGSEVKFPKGNRNKKTPRVAFGRNGKGRHAAFCFDDNYSVETWRDGSTLTAKVQWTKTNETPLRLASMERKDKSGNGTRIWGKVERHLIDAEVLSETLGSKFLVDPSFEVVLNGHSLELVELKFHTTHTVLVPDLGEIIVHRVDAPAQDRTIKLRGITYWVQGRKVGEPSWDGLDERGALLDGRTQAAKRFSFIVEANVLNPGDIREDWSDFNDNERVSAVRDAARVFVMNQLDAILSESRRERKIEALSKEREILRRLPKLSQKVVGVFIDEVQRNCPLLTDKELSMVAQVLTKLEQARSGYEILHKLASCTPDDIDTWNEVMGDWTASNAEVVLSELKRRLDLIVELQQLVNDKRTDELHQLQPLFERGLWIFGPEYESIHFTSNVQLVTVLRKMFKKEIKGIPKIRPDFVVLPDRSLSVYSADKHGDDGEVIGYQKVMILELKRGGSVLGLDDVQQGQKYPIELIKAKSNLHNTEFSVFVLGSGVGAGARKTDLDPNIHIVPLDYDTILRKSHARTFHLHEKLAKVAPTPDADVEEAISSKSLPLLEGCDERKPKQEANSVN